MFKKYRRKRAYKKYIKSDKWKAKREEKFKSIGGAFCEMGDGKTRYKGDPDGCWGYPLHVHHITYANFGDEKMEDLMVLCGRHHAEQHEHMECPPDNRPMDVRELL